MFVCNAPSILQIDSSSLFLDGIEPFLGHQFSMTKTTKRCSSNFDLLPWQRNLGYFCKNFKLLLLFCFPMESSHFLVVSSPLPLYKTLFFDFWFRPPNPQNWLPKIWPKIHYNSACMADRPVMFALESHILAFSYQIYQIFNLRQMKVGWSKKAIFASFARSIFRTFTSKATFITLCYVAP